jgi:hypothetical protein
MTYMLVIWTLVGLGTNNSGVSYTKYDWRSLGEFSSIELCHSGARELSIKEENFKCIRSK